MDDSDPCPQKAASRCGLGAKPSVLMPGCRTPVTTLCLTFIEHLVTLSGGAFGVSHVSENILGFQPTNIKDLQAVAPS